ncbi:glycosyltransferase family 4 protein [Thermobifida halotolerans]|uniref:Glycosyltransferase family 4 protein n=1 Tax=Thermobifida halotolerans TaxID=483545 RepID=A0AA97LUW7_9ACTN|nr:glycosyltransferase family 4 protein [Thermobifida halotolerans]UOE18532.1 glycosyltransferase family 4 protein [Thermobifida halotolerans]
MPSQPVDPGATTDSPLEILMVSDVSGRGSKLGGVPVASGKITENLAALPNVNVTLLTVGSTEDHGDARILLIPATDDWESVRLLDVARNGRPSDVPGLPSPEQWRPDFVFGHSRYSGPAAMAIQQRWYPEARLGHFVHMPVRRYAQIQGRPKEEQDRIARIEQEVMARSDLVVGVGPLLTAVAREMAADNPRLPAFHEMIPGAEITGAPVVPVQGQSTTILFTGRVNDAIKGYDHLLRTVGELRQNGVDVRLRVRGVAESNVEAETRRAATLLGSAEAVDIRPYTSDDAELEADFVGAQLAVMPSVAEGYGLVAAEAAARGLPVLVNAESGFGQFLSDTNRVPEAVGRSFVVPDRGLDDRPDERVAEWARAISNVIEDYPTQVARAAELRSVLQEYSWRDASTALVNASLRSAVDSHGHTVQGAGGRLLGPDGRAVDTSRSGQIARGTEFVALDHPAGRGPFASGRPGRGGANRPASARRGPEPPSFSGRKPRSK